MKETPVSDPVVNTTVFDHVVEVVFEEFDRFVFPAVGLGRHLVQVHFVQNDPIVVGATLRGGIDFVQEKAGIARLEGKEGVTPSCGGRRGSEAVRL